MRKNKLGKDLWSLLGGERAREKILRQTSTWSEKEKGWFQELERHKWEWQGQIHGKRVSKGQVVKGQACKPLLRSRTLCKGQRGAFGEVPAEEWHGLYLFGTLKLLCGSHVKSGFGVRTIAERPARSFTQNMYRTWDESTSGGPCTVSLSI